MEASMFRLLLQELRFRRNAIIGWAIGISFLPAMYIGIYPQIAADLEGLQNIMDLQIYQAMGISFGSFEEWFGSTIINIVPIIVAIYAVIDGTGTLAGEEEAGKLELVISLPIPRWQIVTVKAIAHGIALFLILLVVSIVTTIVFFAIEGEIETSLAWTDVLWGLLYTTPLVLAVGMISLFLGAFAPHRRTAALISAVIVLVSYFGSNLSSQVSTLESIQPLFLFHYLNSTADLFVTGPQTSDILVLLGVALVAFILALVFFQQRDVTVGIWPWRRARKVPT
jgi:ABC-2 type transport system permease protein